MSNALVVITDKVTQMIKSMVYLAMRVCYRQGATVDEISHFLDDWSPDHEGVYHQGIVERVLQELSQEGKVAQAGGRWYPAGAVH